VYQSFEGMSDDEAAVHAVCVTGADVFQCLSGELSQHKADSRMMQASVRERDHLTINAWS
jgi:hypothetical protein